MRGAIGANVLMCVQLWLKVDLANFIIATTCCSTNHFRCLFSVLVAKHERELVGAHARLMLDYAMCILCMRRQTQQITGCS